MYFEVMPVLEEKYRSNEPGAAEELADAYSNLATFLIRQSMSDEAAMMHRKALDILMRIFGPHHPRVAKMYHTIGICNERQWKYTEAVEMIDKAERRFFYFIATSCIARPKQNPYPKHDTA